MTSTIDCILLGVWKMELHDDGAGLAAFLWRKT